VKLRLFSTREVIQDVPGRKYLPPDTSGVAVERADRFPKRGGKRAALDTGSSVKHPRDRSLCARSKGDVGDK